jgi:hypothetical protein
MNNNMRSRIEKNKKEVHEVAALLQGVRKVQDDPDPLTAIPIRMQELSSMIAVILAATENSTYDEGFYREHISGSLRLLNQRFEDLEVMTAALIDESFAIRQDKKKSIKAAA